MRVRIKVEAYQKDLDYNEREKLMWSPVYEQIVDVAEDRNQLATLVKSIAETVNQ